MNTFRTRPWHYFAALFLPGLLCITQFSQILELSIGEEGGHASHTWNWSPLYQLLYRALMPITSSHILSFTIIAWTLSLVLMPLTVFLTARKFQLSSTLSLALSLYSIFCDWNFPPGSYVQLFNFVLTMLAFNLRFLRQRTFGLILFYGILLTTTLLCRQETFIIMMTFFLADFVRAARTQTPHRKMTLLTLTGLATVSISLYLFFIAKPENQERQVYAFTERIYYRNWQTFDPEALKESYYPNVLPYFDNAKTLPAAVMARPLEALRHFNENLKLLPSRLTAALWPQRLMRENLLWSLFWLLVLTIALVQQYSRTTTEPTPTDCWVLSLALLIKCTLIGILLAPIESYIFETSVALLCCGLAGLVKLIERHRPHVSWSSRGLRLESILLALLILIAGWVTTRMQKSHGLRETAAFLQQLSSQSQVKVFSVGFCEWALAPENCFFPLQHVMFGQGQAPENRFGHSAVRSKGLREYFKHHGVNVFIVDDITRKIFFWAGLENEFTDLVHNPEQYGFSAVFKIARVSFGRARRDILVLYSEDQKTN